MPSSTHRRTRTRRPRRSALTRSPVRHGAGLARRALVVGSCLAALASPSSGQTEESTLGGTPGEFGGALDAQGDALIVGARLADGPLTSASGQADVYRRVGGAWVFEEALVANDPETNDEFGRAVAIEGNVTAIGAHLEDQRGNNAGAVYLFRDDGLNWTQADKLLPMDLDANDRFGRSVALSGDRLIAGGQGKEDDLGFENSGAAWIYENDGLVWNEQAMLVAPEPQGGDVFGFAVDIDGDVAIVGAYGADNARGEAHVFRFIGGNWRHEATLTATTPAPLDEVGRAVALEGDVAIVGARGVDSNAGAALVFRYDGNTWTKTQTLVAADRTSGDRFGSAVSLADGWVVVGSPNDDDAGSSSGSAYVFKEEGGTFQPRFKLRAGVPDAGDQFGLDVTMRRGQMGAGLVVGARKADAGDGTAHPYSDLVAWEHRGAPLAGAAGEPTLTGFGSLASGTTVAISLASALPNAPTTLVIGLSEASVPFKGGVLTPSPDALIGLLVPPTGSLPLVGPWPPGYAGLSIVMQHWILDPAGPLGFAASNGLVAHVP